MLARLRSSVQLTIATSVLRSSLNPASPKIIPPWLMGHGEERLRAVLGPAHGTHPRAAATLLEDLALWHQMPLAVALCVDDSGSSSALHLYDALGEGARSLHFDVAVVARDHRARARRLPGLGRFADSRLRDQPSLATMATFRRIFVAGYQRSLRWRSWLCLNRFCLWVGRAQQSCTLVCAVVGASDRLQGPR